MANRSHSGEQAEEPGYGLLTPGFFRDPYPAYARMRDADPVYFHEPLNAWLLSRYEDVDLLLRDRRTSADRVGPLLAEAPPELHEEAALLGRFLGDWMIFADAPEHTRLRGLMTRTFSARAIAGLRAFTARTCDELLDEAAAQGEFDLIGEVAMALPLRVIGHILGISPGDLDDFKQWSADLMAVPMMSGEPKQRYAGAIAAVHCLEALCGELITQRRARPGAYPDLLGHLVAAEVDGQSLTDEELVACCALIVIAGHETTSYAIGNAVLALLEHPEQLAALRADPAGRAGAAFEEGLRWNSLSGWVGRTATAELAVRGRLIPEGSLVFGLTGSANRDERAFDRPEVFDIARPAAATRRHLTFGHGLHMCLGAALARMEGGVCLEKLVTRMPGLRLRVPAAEVDWLQGLALHGPATLPVKV
ncbi:cytochrome P450 [Streptomyces sp. NBC_00249]|uniref:cytochrome P450 n=1 Tax=Streptomyces sp. NBC_00249 TaxID=2975690 RepID=UPI002250A8FE|nr:cytochrome P450 [Streptomyces sp. NBC_00249]MCX5196161.1 cytochrome P450 [Streptomyces sp. NBC_00249]